MGHDGRVRGCMGKALLNIRVLFSCLTCVHDGNCTETIRWYQCTCV